MTRSFPAALIAVAAALCAACTDNSGPTTDPSNALPGLVVSPPMPGTAAGSGSAASATVSGMLTYVSLSPGSVPDGIHAAIRNGRAGTVMAVLMVDGGFDPVAVAANMGDTIFVEVTRAAGSATVNGFQVVLAGRAPRVVRTSPPPGKKDVPLNAVIVVVFSAPIDSTTLDTSSVTLWRGSTPVHGTVRIADTEHVRAEFHPDSLLLIRTDYVLDLSRAIHDVNGVALDSAATVPFTTAATGPSSGLVFASVSAGFEHSCGVTTTGEAYCWGDNSSGELGDGTLASSATPVAVSGGLPFTAVSAGYSGTCGLGSKSALFCWGSGSSALGAGPTPVKIDAGTDFVSVSLGEFHACGVTTSGAAYCWGDPGSGELGDGSVSGGSSPVLVAGGLAFAAVSAGTYSSCGITTAGAAYCWGTNALAALGTGSSTGPQHCYGGQDDSDSCSPVPVAVAGGLIFRQVEAKTQAACGIATDGTAYCWGSDLNDNLGFGTKTGPELCNWSASYTVPCSRVPLAVPGVPKLVSISATDSYSCGLTAAGAAYCWGYPFEVGDLSSNTGPVPVPGGLTFAMLSVGRYHMCGVTTDGVAYCWGFNDYGELGDGTTTFSDVPVKVAGQP